MDEVNIEIVSDEEDQSFKDKDHYKNQIDLCVVLTQAASVVGQIKYVGSQSYQIYAQYFSYSRFNALEKVDTIK